MLGFRVRLPREYPISQSSPESSKHGEKESGSSGEENGLGLRVSDSSSEYYYGPHSAFLFLIRAFQVLLGFIAFLRFGWGIAWFIG